MTGRYTAAKPFRLAICGDSWVTDVDLLPGGRKCARSVAGCALRRRVERHRGAVDFTVAGFPGLTSWAMLDLSQTCTVRDMARLSAECYAMSKYSAKTQCQWEDIPVIQDGRYVEENLDLVVVMVGSNDLVNCDIYAHQWSHEIYQNLWRVGTNLRQRGVPVIFCSLFLSEELKATKPWLEVQRQKINRQLRRDFPLIELDDLLNHGRYDPWLWKDGYHLTKEGFRYLGDLLGEQLVCHFANGFQLGEAYQKWGRGQDGFKRWGQKSRGWEPMARSSARGRTLRTRARKVWTEWKQTKLTSRRRWWRE